MAILPLAATPPSSVSPPASVDFAQAVLARETELSLSGESSSAASAAVDVSQTGRLLSSVAEIENAASAAETGTPLDSGVVVEQAQRFVDSVNALNLGGQLTADAVLDIPAEAPGGAAAGALPEPPPGTGNRPVLTLDSTALETALEIDAAAATSRLAAIAAPVAETVSASLAPSAQLPTGAPSAQSVTPDAPIVTQTLRATGPNSVTERAQLEEALADTLLVDIVSTAADSAGAQAATRAAPQTTALTQANATTVSSADTLAPAQAVPANIAPTTRILGVTGTANPASTAAAAAVQAGAILTPADLVTTPLEQIAQLARNPVVAGTVAAFQIPVDDGGRAARVGVPSGLDSISPTAAVAASEAIGPNLANNSNQRRDDSPDARTNRWLATRPGLI